MAVCIRNFFTRHRFTTPQTTPPDTIERLFPAPTKFPPSVLSPHAFPGTSSEAEQALLEILKHNHQNNHIYFNDKEYQKWVAPLASFFVGQNWSLT